jgi:membrane protein DedA with SNARE-associated domain
MIKTGLMRFLLFDTAGLLVWSGAYVTLGYVFSNQLEHLLAYLSQFGNSALVFAVIAVAAYIAFKGYSIPATNPSDRLHLLFISK